MKNILEAFNWLLEGLPEKNLGSLSGFTRVDTTQIKQLIASDQLKHILLSYWSLSFSEIPSHQQDLMLRLTHEYKPETKGWSPENGVHPFSIAELKIKADELIALLRFDLAFC